MKKIILLVIISLFVISFSFGQGTIRGKVADANGETLIGVIISLKSNRSYGTSTDLDGNYSLKITDSTAQTILVSYIGYRSQEEVVHPVKGEVIIRNFVLASSLDTLNVVEITGKAVKANNYYMEKLKQNSSTTIDYISAETMKKTGDVNVVAAVARVSGVSTSGGFITVRGIGDRYVKTTVNGSRIPTLDPFTNNIKLDMFPASLVDNIIITKTASPDLPGDWAGAYLSVETKDYPDKLSVNVETSIGYNSQSTFKDVISSQRSSTDWLGYDNGFRDHNHNDFVAANMSPTTYQEMVALGLGDYYKSIGVTGNTPWTDTYYKLGLVKLGLLAPAQFNDPGAFTNAKNQYYLGPYQVQAFNTINAGAAKTGQSFADNWGTTTRKAPLNFSQSFSIGNQVNLFGRPLGFLAGFRYGSSIQYDPNSTVNRAAVVSDGNGNYVKTVSSAIDQKVSRETNGWSALMNLAYKINPNHSISLLFMPNLTGVNNVRYSFDYGDIKTNVLTQSQFYEQRKQLIYQLKSEHYLPGPKMKIEFNASYTDGKSSAPDFKNVQYWKDPVTGVYQIGGSIGDGIHRYYRYLSDNLFDSRLSAELPIGEKPGFTRKLKFGGAYQYNYRTSDQYQYSVYTGPYNTNVLLNDNVDQYLSLSNFTLRNYTDNYGQNHPTMDCFYAQDNSPANHTFGRSSVAAGYAMIDYAIITSLRFSGGMRVEQSNTLTDVVKFDSLGYAANDVRRSYLTGMPAANPGKLDELNFLPSANIIYKLKDSEEAPMNLRLNYSHTVARPGIRELSDVAVFDYEYRAFVFGNSDLKIAHIDNYDLRWESYFKSGDNLSASLFYKDFKNHIELVKSIGISWQNVDKSTVAGIELEGKKKLPKHFELSANVTFVNSQTTFVRSRMEVTNGVRKYIPVDTVKRPMFGQAPFVINTILSYTADSIGLTAAISYNVQGARLAVASDGKEIPDIYELPRHLVDIKVTKKLSKHFNLSFTVRDILNSPIRRSYKYPEGWTLDYDKYRYGTNYVLGLSYKL